MSGTKPKLPTFYTPEEIASSLRVDVRTVYEWLQNDRLQGVKAGKYWRVADEALTAFLATPRGRGGKPKTDPAKAVQAVEPAAPDPSQRTIYDELDEPLPEPKPAVRDLIARGPQPSPSLAPMQAGRGSSKKAARRR